MAKPRLNQIVAVVTGKKSRAEKEFGELNKIVQRADLFNGFVRQYRPLKDNEEEKQPEEYKSPQQDVKDIIARAREVITGIADAIATQECGNCVTSGDVVIDGKVLLSGMPVTVLLICIPSSVTSRFWTLLNGGKPLMVSSARFQLRQSVRRR